MLMQNRWCVQDKTKRTRTIEAMSSYLYSKTATTNDFISKTQRTLTNRRM